MLLYILHMLRTMRLDNNTNKYSAYHPILRKWLCIFFFLFIYHLVLFSIYRNGNKNQLLLQPKINGHIEMLPLDIVHVNLLHYTIYLKGVPLNRHRGMCANAEKSQRSAIYILITYWAVSFILSSNCMAVLACHCILTKNSKCYISMQWLCAVCCVVWLYK